VRDAQGNVMSVYEHKVDNTAQTLTYTQQEKHIYGSSRVGMDVAEKNMISTSVTVQSFYRESGKKQYELSNHLGNVLAVTTDKKIPVENSSLPGEIEFFIAELLMSTDYSPFGVNLMQRNYNSENFKYGYNSMERDDEIKGKGNSYTTEFRQNDTRLGRWLSLDPRMSGWESPYASMGNTPIWATDVRGDKFTKRGNIEVKKYKEELKQIRKNLKADIKNYHPGLSPRSKEELQERLNEVRQIRKELKELKKYPQLYDIRFDENLNAEGVTRFDPRTGIVEITIGQKPGSDWSNYKGTLAHELTHMYQFQSGRMSLTYRSEQTLKILPEDQRAVARQGGGELYDKLDEREAFYRDALIMNPHYDPSEPEAAFQDAYGSALLVSTPRDINTKEGSSTTGARLIQQMRSYNAGTYPDVEVIYGWEKYIERKNLPRVLGF
jgi:RHS repeat-associated protein